MKRAIVWMQAFALSIGGPGLFVIAFLDSSVLSLPEINDILIIWMVTRHPHRMVYYATMATLGSLAGCFVLYYLGRKGGDALIRRRFHERHIDRALGLFQRYGLLALLVPALLPPPAPFKIFVLLAGVAAVRPVIFAVALCLGRGLRYFGEGILALWYGEMAIEYLRANGKIVGMALAALIVVSAAAFGIWRRIRRDSSGL